MRIAIQALACLSAVFAVSTADAAIVTFDFVDGSAGTPGFVLDGQSTGSVAVDGVTLSATAGPSGSLFWHNSGSGGDFGVNHPDPGDETDAFDGDNGAESMVFSFDTAGSLSSIDFDRLTTATDELSISISGGSSINLDADNTSSGLYTFGSSEALDLGSFSGASSLSLSFAAGNWF